MGKSVVQGHNTSRESKRQSFSSPETSRKGVSTGVIGVAAVVVLAVVAGTVLYLTRPSSAAPLPATRIISDAAAAPSAQTAVDDGSGGVVVSAATYGHEPYAQAVAEDGIVRIPVSTVNDHEAHYYTYMHDGRSIEFFVLESPDGTLRAAFNACDVCFLSKKGYTRDGDAVICNNCGLRFPADQINEVRGGCNPSPLDRTVEGDYLLIRAEDIAAGLQYF